MNYWLDLFTGTTWEEFNKSGATVSGFRQSQRAALQRVKPGDIFLCYLTGVMRWIGALEVVGPSRDTRQIWKGQDFPVRFDVRPLLVLSPEHGVPMTGVRLADRRHPDVRRRHARLTAVGDTAPG
jgi:hypothetical protein